MVILPGGVLPGGFAIGARKTYGQQLRRHDLLGRELGLGDDHAGIIVLPADVPAKPGDDARPVVGLDDVVVELEITPDRGYALSACAASPGSCRTPSACRSATRRRSDRRRRGGHRAQTRRTRCEVRDTGRLRPVRGPGGPRRRPGRADARTGCSSGSTVAGIRSISLPVDITNYVMLELGQPMHAFDLDRLRGAAGRAPGGPGGEADHPGRCRPGARPPRTWSSATHCQHGGEGCRSRWPR